MALKEMGALALLAALWAGSFLFIRMAAPEFGPLPLMAARVLCAALILGVVLSALRRPVRLRAYTGGVLVLGALNAAIPFTLIAWAELRLSASLAAMLNATVPLFTAVVGAVWLGEPIAARLRGGLVLGIAGVGVLVGWSPLVPGTATALSVMAMLAAALCYAFAAVYTHLRLAGAPAPTLALGQQLAAAAWLGLPALWSLPARAPAPRAMWALGALALLSTAIAYLLYFYLVARVGPTATNSVTFLIPIFGAAWGRLFLNEPVTGGMLVGLACVLASLFLVVGRPAPSPRRPRSLKSEPITEMATPTPALLPCPFCGSPAALEQHPCLPAALRVACGEQGCGVRPATEYLLDEYHSELAAAWNARRPLSR
ncbi:MAG TPA: EamA family transporter [Longimicrobium sp.]|jgi:drug/metabolite transporter (DMT)-like permease